MKMKKMKKMTCQICGATGAAKTCKTCAQWAQVTIRFWRTPIEAARLAAGEEVEK